MIRLKCPKCATSLALEDDEAGGVGECTSCGAKFRVPARPAAVAKAAPRRRDDEDEDDDEDEEAREARRRRSSTARRRRDEDDDEDEDEGPDEVEREKQQRIARQRMEAFWLNIRVSIALMIAAFTLGVAGIFINRLWIYTMVIGGLMVITCMFMVSRMAKQESMLWFMLIRFIPSMIFIYIILNWEQTKRYLIFSIVGMVLLGIGFVSGIIHEAKKIARRIVIEERAKTVWVAPADWERLTRVPPSTVAAWVALVPAPGRLHDAA